VVGRPCDSWGFTNELNFGDMYLSLSAAGDEVRVYASMEVSADTLKGLLVRTRDWEAELPWIREAGPNGVIIFESAHAGQTQDRLRREGYNVIGGSSYGDRLELDREFGQQAMPDASIQQLFHSSSRRYLGDRHRDDFELTTRIINIAG
jgi:phosphoribosylamine--glycine ligase